jgi:CRP-like cAMP-binding protein
MRADGLCQDCRPEFIRIMTMFKSGDRVVAGGRDLIIFGEPCAVVYRLCDGWVCLYKPLPDGRRQIVHFALPDTLLGFPPTEGGMAYGAQALTDVTVSIIPRHGLAAMFREQPEMAIRIAALVSRDRDLAFDHLSNIGRRTARERVARLLLELFVRSRMRWPGYHTEEMLLPITQEDIGDATGLTGVHVNRVLRDLRQEQIVEFHYRRLRVINPDELLDAAGVDTKLAFSWLPRTPPG